jgi:hypothetical protein
MVIYVQQKQQELPVSLTSAGSSNSTEQQLDTLMPQVCSSSCIMFGPIS